MLDITRSFKLPIAVAVQVGGCQLKQRIALIFYLFNPSLAPLGQQNQFTLLGLTNSAGATIGNTNFADPIIPCLLVLQKPPPVPNLILCNPPGLW
jgi:hypothetical protein